MTAQFLGMDNLDQKQEQEQLVVLSHEHSEYCWLLPQEALHLVEHEGVRSDIEALMAELSRNQAHQAHQAH